MLSSWEIESEIAVTACESRENVLKPEDFGILGRESLR